MVPCSQVSTNLDSEMLCSTPCPSLRSCGRHQCTTKCCPASVLGALSTHNRKKGKGKKKAPPSTNSQGLGWEQELERLEKEELEREWHTCDFVCGKQLSCGRHQCEERDHKGACPSCLRSSFEEVCHASAYLSLCWKVNEVAHVDDLSLWADGSPSSYSMWDEDKLSISLFEA